MNADTLNERLREEVLRARKKLDDMRRSTSSAFDASPFAGVVFDAGGGIVECNRASVDFFGYGTKEELVDNASSFVGSVTVTSEPGRGDSLRARLALAAERGRDSFDAVLRLFDGREIPMKISLSRIETEDSYQIALYYQEMTDEDAERARSDTSEKLLGAVNKISSMLMTGSAQAFPAIMRRALEVIAKSIGRDRASVWRKGRRGATELVPVYIWEDRKYALGEQRVEETVILVPSWMESLKAGRIIHATERDAPEPERELLEARGTMSILFVPVNVGGKFWGAFSLESCDFEQAAPNVDNGVLQNCSLLIASAIMRNKMATDLIEAKKAALQSAEAKNSFLANMSHEIRTPMNAIMGMTAIARSAKGDIVKIEECLSKIEAASRHMMGIISDVLDISKMESKQMSIDEFSFSFREMLQGIVDMNMIRVGERHQKILTMIDKNLHDDLLGDPLRIGQVINNLLSNASKFSHDGDTINIKVSAVETREHESVVCVSVEDTGVGIPPEHLAHIFDTFRQGDGSLARKYEGTGLGLSIARNIIDLMGGEIHVDSTVGRGSRFWFNLTLKHGAHITHPDDKEHERTIEPASDHEDEGGATYIEYDFSGKKILVVDDVEINREIVGALMEETNAEIVYAENGAESIETFIADPSIDLIFMDIHMPVMDGLEATRRIRASGAPNASTVPIVALTANAFADDVDICAAAGMNDHMAKPIDPSMLMEKTCVYIKGKRIRRRAE